MASSSSKAAQRILVASSCLSRRSRKLSVDKKSSLRKSFLLSDVVDPNRDKTTTTTSPSSSSCKEAQPLVFISGFLQRSLKPPDLTRERYGNHMSFVRGFAWWSRSSRVEEEATEKNGAIVEEDIIPEVSSEEEEEREVGFQGFSPDDSSLRDAEAFPWSGENKPRPSSASNSPSWNPEDAAAAKADVRTVLLRSVEEKQPVNETLAAETTSSSSIWSFLQVPVDAVIVTLDGFHNATGIPWWLTIVGSTLALRAALFPLTVTQLQKASALARLGSQLPSPVPVRGSGKSMADQYRIFTKRRLELGAPSPAWLIAVPLVQVPLFITWIVAVRQMAMASHPGFDCGGILWFTDLTVPVQGALGALFPTLVAVTYFINLQISFKGIEKQKGMMGTLMKFYKWWLEAATIPAFIFGFYLPQGVFMYWLTNNCCSLAQTIALRQPQVRAKLGLPLLSELTKLRETPPPSQSRGPSELKEEAVENMSADELLVLAANCIAQGKEDEALQVLHYTTTKYSNSTEALFALGKIYIGRKQWSEALQYYNLVLEKTKDNKLVIAAALGAGVALFKEGKRAEAIEVMSVITRLDVPKDALSQHRYFQGLVTLSSALSQEGNKAQALALLKKAAEYEPMVASIYVSKLEEELRLENTKNN
ncbi:unnamed protein product [Sphagnum troendelagicum]|uniref:ALBINO3-like protein 2, chloroplastic n=1 Tax=Sphagnum troendelagicum TaxID=128251 RepID=A0ABP0TT75_9BRYO